MIIVFLFRAVLCIEMNVESVSTINLANSNGSYFVKNSNLASTDKQSKNVGEEQTPLLDKGTNSESIEITDETLNLATLKQKNWNEHYDRPVDILVTGFGSDMNSEAANTKDTISTADAPPGENFRPDSGIIKVTKCEPNRDVVKEERDTLGSKEEVSRYTDEPMIYEQKKVCLKKKWNELWDEPVDIPPGLSKRQKKKYVRKVLWETKWKPLRRAKEKEKLKQKKLQARVNNETLGPSRKMLKHSTMSSSKCKLRIVLDFSFDHLMSEKDLSKCLKQLNHCYCLNRRATNPLQLHVTNFCGTAKEQLSRGVAYKNWDVNFHEEKYLNIFKPEELVYLTSDSDNTLAELDHSKVYIIGALVDHNKYKGKTLEIAQNEGINHAKLPISDFLQMNSRKVLTIDHVFEILVYASGGSSWKDSFLKVLPQRKGAMEKNT